MKNFDSFRKDLNDLFANFEPADYLDPNFDADSFDDLTDLLDDRGAFNRDIIYYYKAMEYLAENDNSLSESLELANEWGYQLENITSEVLASLHLSEKCRNEWADNREEVAELLVKYTEEELNEELENELI